MGEHTYGVDHGVHQNGSENAAASAVDPSQDQTGGDVLHESQYQIQGTVNTNKTQDVNGGKNGCGQKVGGSVALGIQRAEDQSSVKRFFRNGHKNHSTQEHDHIIFVDHSANAAVIEIQEAGEKQPQKLRITPVAQPVGSGACHHSQQEGTHVFAGIHQAAMEKVMKYPENEDKIQGKV
jgi:hypothetical protein